MSPKCLMNVPKYLKNNHTNIHRLLSVVSNKYSQNVSKIFKELTPRYLQSILENLENISTIHQKCLKKCLKYFKVFKNVPKISNKYPPNI